MDELEAASLLIHAQENSDGSNEQGVLSAIVHFHQNRHYLLECLRLLLRYVVDADHAEEEQRPIFLEIVSHILVTKNGSASNASLYVYKCFAAMDETERWLQNLAERAQGALALGQSLSPWFVEASLFQQSTLSQQHESLGTIVTLLVKADFTTIENFHKLLDKVSRLERWNQSTVHYIPILMAFITHFGSSEGCCTFREATALNAKFMDSARAASWTLGTLHAVATVFWLSEYTSWYTDPPTGSPMQGINLETEAFARTEAFSKALADGAFQCLLLVCSYLKPSQWFNPTRNGLIDFLLRDAPSLNLEASSTSSYFQDTFMEQLETFTSAFITNMPDTLRRFKVEEDDQRRWLRSGQSGKGYGRSAEQELHLERFMVMITFAYQARPEASAAFWEDPDGNLYGYLQWASRRLSTPQVAAFCVMLSSIAEGNDSATSAHQFLQGDSKATLPRQHRSSSLSWPLIFEELSMYTSKVRDRSITHVVSNQAASASNIADISEPESVLMLECYLRLAAKICRESGEAAQWILSHPSFKMVDNLLLLCSNGVPGRIQSCAFGLLRALSMATNSESSIALWSSIDYWTSGAFGSAAIATRATNASSKLSHVEETNFDAIAGDLEMATEFTALLCSLMLPRDDVSTLHDKLPFSEQLGSTYRMPGIDPYVDLVFGKIMCFTVPQADDVLQQRILQHNVVDFAATCLETFNENLVILANKYPIDVDSTMATTSLQNYVALHPFHRVMDWMFNENVIKEIFAASHQDVHELASAALDSPLVLLVCRCLDTMNLVMDLQSTYLQILRPSVSAKTGDHHVSVFSSSVVSFQDAVAGNLTLIVDLAKYSGIGIHALTTTSLSLLGKLASSRRLSSPMSSSVDPPQGNRLIEILQQRNELESIQQFLILAMIINDRELDQGPESNRWLVKSSILDFLIRCLEGNSSRMSLAHALLGFTCQAQSILVEDDSTFARGAALFHAVLNAVLVLPDRLENNMLGWILSIKRKALQVLRALWQSPLTSSITLMELQNHNFLSQLFAMQFPVDFSTDWDGRTIEAEDFIYTESVTCFEDYFYQRDALLDLASQEIRLSEVADVGTLSYNLLPALLGSSPDAAENYDARLSILDLLDITDLEPSQAVSAPSFTFFAGLNGEALAASGYGVVAGRSTKVLEDLVSLQFSQLDQSGRLASQMDVENAEAEASSILLVTRGQVHTQIINALRLSVLKSWSSSLVLIFSILNSDGADKSLLISQTLDLMIPRLEQYATDVRPEAIQIAKLLQHILQEHALPMINHGEHSSNISIADKIFRLLQIAIHAIYNPDGSAELREILYGTCQVYLNSSIVTHGADELRKRILHTVKVAGSKLLETICDDALGELGSCRVSALSTLKCFQNIAHTMESEYLTTSLSQASFIVVLIEGIQDLALELRETASRGIFFPPLRVCEF